MDRFLPLDVTLQTLGAHLYPDEHILTHADSVGLYDGKDKSPRHADGRAVLTSHRILYVSSSRPHANSAYLPLSLVRQTEYWVGFLKSSPKITLLLAERTSASSGSANEAMSAAAAGGDAQGDRERDKTREALALAALAGERNWVCRVCGMHNVPTAQLGLKCSLCGVTRDPTPSSSSSSRPPPPPHASSAPPSRYGTPTPPPRPPRPDAQPAPAPAPAPAAAPLDPTETGARLACPVCTFLNHHSMTRCEVCDSVLLPPSPPRSSSAGAGATAPPSRTNSLRSLGPSRAGTPGPGTDPASAAPVAVPIAGAGSGAGAAAQAFVRLSFRKGGEKAFYAALKEAMGAKAWDLGAAAATAGGTKGGKGARSGKSGEGEAGRVGESEGGRGVGIDAILRGVDLDARDREDSLDDALKDLESLMRKAKDMITLAQSINAQLASSAASPSNGSSAPATTPAAAARAASLASSSLHSLGLAVLDSAVTPDLVADDRAYHAELARELAGVLEKGKVMERKGGIVGLDEVWCLWNRARGVALVSPKDLRLAAPFLPTLPTASPAARLSLRVFHPSGLTILHTPRFAPRAFESRVLDLLDTRQALVASLALSGAAQGEEEPAGGASAAEAAEREGASLLDIAHAEGLSVGLAKELLGVLELGERGGAGAGGGGGASAGGAVVRDEQAGEGTRWYRNWISAAVWDGQEF
ncbi:hypothetical protein JCM9279_003403 [Rhodotorula babjevae]